MTKFVTAKIKKIQISKYTGKVYNLEVEPNHPIYDDQYYIDATTGIVVHNCHPRDNIALRLLSTRLDLGYDLFGSIMEAREQQTKNFANTVLSYGKNITIVGKAYKPGVPYVDGSPSVLLGHYIMELGGNVRYYDEHTGDVDLHEAWTDVYVIGYWDKYTESLQFTKLVIDPWRRIDNTQASSYIHYGNTR